MVEIICSTDFSNLTESPIISDSEIISISGVHIQEKMGRGWGTGPMFWVCGVCV